MEAAGNTCVMPLKQTNCNCWIVDISFSPGKPQWHWGIKKMALIFCDECCEERFLQSKWLPSVA